MIQKRIRAGSCAGKERGQAPRSAADIARPGKKRSRAALDKPGRTEGVRKIASRFGVDPGTVQRISRPFEAASVAA
jgi:hypothetical protein